MATIAFLSRSPGLLNRGPGGPASLWHVPHSSIFSPTGLISNCSFGGLRAPSAASWFSLPHLISNWLNFLCTELYNNSTPTFFLWAAQIVLIQPVHGQGYILIFLDRMNLLFTPVHFLFWQPGRVGGQYTTLRQTKTTIYHAWIFTFSLKIFTLWLILFFFQEKIF